MEPDQLKTGEMYSIDYITSAYYIDDRTREYAIHETYDLCPGDIFMILSINEIIETQTVDIEILHNNQKMWFTFHTNDSMLGNVRRAGSYDIPFVVLNELEPGSNSTP